MPMFHVKVRGGVMTASTDPPSDGDFGLEVTGTVAVEAADEAAARERALDVIMGVGEDCDPALMLGDGEVVEFEVVSVELAPAEAAP